MKRRRVSSAAEEVLWFRNEVAVPSKEWALGTFVGRNFNLYSQTITPQISDEEVSIMSRLARHGYFSPLSEILELDYLTLQSLVQKSKWHGM